MQIIPLFEGKGLSFADWVEKSEVDDENITFTFSKKKPRKAQLILILQDNGVLFPGIKYHDCDEVFCCGRFCVKDETGTSPGWHDIDLRSLPRTNDECMKAFADGKLTIKLLEK